jgi:anti-sigma B factor antagonist
VAPLTVSVAVRSSGPQPYTLVELTGDADVTGGETLRGVLEAETRKKPGLLVIEMSGLRFMDSSALQAIVRANLALAADGGRLALVAPRDTVARVLRMTEVDQLVPVHASVEEASRKPK